MFTKVPNDTTPHCFVGKRPTAGDDYTIHSGPGPAGCYLTVADGSLAAQNLMGPPENNFDTQVFVPDPNLHYRQST